MGDVKIVTTTIANGAANSAAIQLGGKFEGYGIASIRPGATVGGLTSLKVQVSMDGTNFYDIKATTNTYAPTADTVQTVPGYVLSAIAGYAYVRFVGNGNTNAEVTLNVSLVPLEQLGFAPAAWAIS